VKALRHWGLKKLINSKLKKEMRQGIELLGFNEFARHLFAQYPRIIMFHRVFAGKELGLGGVVVEDFRRILLYIKRSYRAMTVSELFEVKSSIGSYPKNAVAITFDDGYENFYDLAWPLLREFNLPATVFVVPDLINNQKWLWFDRFIYIGDALRKVFSENKVKNLMAEMKRQTAEQREKLLGEFARNFGVSIPEQAPAQFRLMSWDMLKKLSRSKLIEVGSHTLSHPILANESDEKAWVEIYESKNIIETKLGVLCKSFCYPNGLRNDYRIDQVGMVRRAGYVCGIAAHFGFVTSKSNLFALPRIDGDHVDMYSFYKCISGVDCVLRGTLCGD
jgi:peptidoglycan/xylan/chitin deacetylase (PgdA/CDA1 family)